MLLRFAAISLIASMGAVTAVACRQVDAGPFPSSQGRLPNLKRTHSGTLTIATRSSVSGSASEVCSATLRIEQQNDADGTHTGVLTTSGGSGNCDQAGSVTGQTERYTSDPNYKPRLTVVPGTQVLPPPSCTRTDGDGVFRGQLGGNNDMTLMAADAYACSNPEGTISRTLTLYVHD